MTCLKFFQSLQILMTSLDDEDPQRLPNNPRRQYVVKAAADSRKEWVQDGCQQKGLKVGRNVVEESASSVIDDIFYSIAEWFEIL